MNNNIFIWTELSMQNRTAKHSTVCRYGTLCMSVSNSHSPSLPWGVFRFGNCVERWGFFSNLAANSCLVSLFNRRITCFVYYWGGIHIHLLKVRHFWKRDDIKNVVCESMWLRFEYNHLPISNNMKTNAVKKIKHLKR